MNLIKKIKSLTYLIPALLTTPVFAVSELPPGRAITPDEIYSIVVSIARFLIIASVSLAVIAIILSGLTYMYAGENSAIVMKAREKLKTAVIGTLIVLGVGVIINTVAAVVTREFFCQISVLGVCLY